MNDSNKLAVRMLITMVSGILVGQGFMAVRETTGADSALWGTINSILFQNISVSGGYDVSAFQLVIIMVLALIAYSLILAINRPIEMLVTSVNVTGDAMASVAVAKSEDKLNEDIYNS